MKKAVTYAIRHIQGTWAKCLAVMLCSVVFVILIQAMFRTIELQRQEIKRLYAEIPIKGVTSDIKGVENDYMYIGEMVLDAVLKEGGLSISKYLRDVALKHTMYANIGDTEYHAIGVNRLQSSSDIDPALGGKVNWLDGYDETILLQSGMYCVVPQSLLDLLGLSMGDTLKITFKNSIYHWGTWDYVKTVHGMEWTLTEFKDSDDLELLIVGAADSPYEYRIYCPFDLMMDLCVERGRDRYAESLSFWLKDSSQLLEFKTRASTHFHQISTNANSGDNRISLTLYDSQLISALANPRRNLEFMLIITPVVFVVAAGIGFLASFIFIRNRLAEFAVMRSLGMKRGAVFFSAFFEQVLLGGLGVLVGTGVSLAVMGTLGHNYLMSLIYLGVFLLGSTAALMRVIFVNVMKILKAKE